MYAVIETGGKQYRVEVGTQLEVELLDVEPGKTISFDRVLLVADGDKASIGQPVVTDAQVSAEVVSQIRGPKTISFKYRPKARSRVKKGHRQELTVIRISDIVLAGKSAAADSKKADDAARTERKRLEEAAGVQAAKDAELAAKLAASAEPATKVAAPKKAPAAKTTATKASAKATATAKSAKSDKPAAKAEAAPAAKKPAAKKAAPAADTAKPAAPARKPRATKKDE